MVRFILHFVIFIIIMTVDIPLWVWFAAFFLEAGYLFTMINIKDDPEFKNLD